MTPDAQPRSHGVYSPTQITAFLNHIGLPQRLHNNGRAPPPLALLTALHTHMISTIPYENLAIHYSPTHQVSLDPQVLFDKAVTRGRGRGGYCMENALLYYHVLCALGFDVYTVGARTRVRDSGGVPGGDFPGWVHIVNIVTLPATASSLNGKPQRYHVDIAFGGDGALSPMPLPLDSSGGTILQNLGMQQIRLVREYIPTQTYRPVTTIVNSHGQGEEVDDDRHKLWIYQYRNNPQAEWNSYYAFTETEFMPLDWEVVNYWTSTSDRSHQTHRPLCILFLRRANNHGREGGGVACPPGAAAGTADDSHTQMKRAAEGAADGTSEETEDKGDFHIYGKRMLVGNVVKENLGGKTQVLAVCETEEQRIRALKEYFGITLTNEEISGIRGFRSELKPDAAVLRA
ncbi:uncharacterized protein B0I36DRAFT_319224 [Microdochium trichocladiopsis]|uniref:Arylamine N-acetyltransferase n=1 Tax=Microdochium trichocladiopsis TaxID=1682393 RepID=A0A9P8YD57_9PEZI|nr:uncharacterized protein B0I36DRAFT_319224 [Microdochium trichocladiopsis]KAH7035859.1 hypothetical protein B0I36DRAFT_319224 [Microdochium trichocladiopsis]